MDNKIKNLIALRNNYFTTLYLVTSGTIGLLLTKPQDVLGVSLLIIGFFIMIVIFFAIIKKSKQITQLLYRKDKECLKQSL